jgi:hypothetical protein
MPNTFSKSIPVGLMNMIKGILIDEQRNQIHDNSIISQSRTTVYHNLNAW